MLNAFYLSLVIIGPALILGWVKLNLFLVEWLDAQLDAYKERQHQRRYGQK